MKLTFLFILIIIFLSSCSALKNKSAILNTQYNYQLKDNSGSFEMSRNVILNEQNNFAVKYEIKSNENNGMLLEKGITISELGYIKNKKQKISIARPKISQYTVWLDGKRYFSQLKTNLKTKKLDILLESPESKWNGKKSVNFPKNQAIICYYSQVLECLKITTFFKQAINLQQGELAFIIIWDGYPYIQEQYLGLSTDNVFSKAKISFDKKISDNLFSFSLEVENQIINYHINKDGELIKMFWISQELSIERF